MWCHYYWIEDNNHLSLLSKVLLMSKDVFGFRCCKGMLLICAHLVHQDGWILCSKVGFGSLIPSLYWCMRLICPKCRTSRLHVSDSPTSSDLLWGAALHTSVFQQLLPIWYHFKLLEGRSVLLFKPLMNVLSHTDHWGMIPLRDGLQLDLIATL